MDKLSKCFKRLHIENRYRYLIGYSDTEGVPHKNKNSNLWNLSIAFTDIVENNVHEEVFHTVNFTYQKNTKFTRYIKTALNIHLDGIHYLKKKYNCDEVILCFWNSPHDKAVLQHYNLLNYFKIVDLLKVVKKITNNSYPSYKLGNVLDHLELTSEYNLHTALGDLLGMQKITQKLNISPKQFPNYIEDYEKDNIRSRLQTTQHETCKVRTENTGPTGRTIPQRTSVSIVELAIEKARRKNRSND